jgi:cytochrome oxidase assembly protein ShyY1
MARVVVGGLFVSTLVTLFLVPVVYTGLSEWQLRRAERRAERDATPPSSPVRPATAEG